MRNFPRNNRRSISVAAIVLLGLALVVSMQSARVALARPVLFLVRPIAYLVDATGTFFTMPLRYFAGTRRLVAENRALRSELASMQESKQLLVALRSENQTLAAATGRDAGAPMALATPPFAGRNPHFAIIISRPNLSFYDTLLIDQGAADGLRPGMTVFSLGGILLGEVDTVLAHQARVVLYSSSSRTTPVLLGKEHLAALATGSGGGNLTVSLPHGTTLSVGDPVTVPHAEPWMLGTIGNIDDRPSNALATILIKSPVNFYELKWVVVTDERLPLPEPILGHATGTQPR